MTCKDWYYYPVWDKMIMHEEYDFYARDKSTVVEVVRCEDCRYFIVEDWQGEQLNHCENSNGMVEPFRGGFCCYGIRKDGGNQDG